jgi:hypothetical protein
VVDYPADFPVEPEDIIRLAHLWAERKESRASAFARIREAAKLSGFTDGEIDIIFREAIAEVPGE